MKSTDIPARFQVPFANSATSSYIRPVPVTTSDPNAASMQLGWPPNTGTPVGAGGSPPDIRDENGILNIITQWSQWGNAGGPVGYDSTFSASIGGYPKGAILASIQLGSFWLSSVDDNTSNPDSGGANWIGFSPVPLTAVGTGTANAMVVTLPIQVAALMSLIGIPISIKKSSAANTSSVTVDLKSSDSTDLGTKTIVHADGSALTSGELPANGYLTVIYDGTYLQLQSPAVNPAQLQVQGGNYAVDSGAVNAIAAAFAPPITTRKIGTPLRVKIANTNTGATTLNYGAGAFSIKTRNGGALQGGELVAGSIVTFIDNGTSIQYSAPSSTLLVPEFGYAVFYWNGSVVVTNVKSPNMTGTPISRTSKGLYVANFNAGTFSSWATVSGGALNTSSGTPQFVGGGIGNVGTQTVPFNIGDAGGSGGELADPGYLCVVRFIGV